MSKQSDFIVKMNMDYEFKKAYAEIRVHEFIKECAKMNKDVYVSVGGIDSITLYSFIKSLGYDIIGAGITSIEHPTVRKVHRELGIIEVKPHISKYHVFINYGIPIFSKEVAGKIRVLQNPTEKNIGYRHAILTGETTGKAKYGYSTITKLSNKYINMYNSGCFDNIKISDKCCYYMKEYPMSLYAKSINAYPFLGLQASESRRRFLSLSNNGCNYINGKNTRSAPFAIFNKSDILHLALELNVHIPEAYGDVAIDDNGNYYTTSVARTGCDICGFGIQYEKIRPHRFDLLYNESPQKWNFWLMQMGYGELFDMIGFQWRQPYIPGEKSWVNGGK